MMSRRSKKYSSRNRLKTRRLLAIGTLAASTAFCQNAAVPAFAKDVPAPNDAASESTPTTALVVRHYDIPAGTLGEALRKFREIAEFTVIVPNQSMLSIEGQAVWGDYTVPEALKQMLSHTGIDYRFTARNAIVLTFKPVNTIVEVSADPATVSSVKFTEPLLETPQSITVVPQRIMEQQGVTNLRDALRNVAGISLAAGEGGAQGDNFTIRGFAARNDIFLDGMRDFGSYYRDPFNTDSVAVLEGPSSVMFGRGSTGGVVNQAAKLPSATSFVNGSLLVGTDQTNRVTADLSQGLGNFAGGAAVRVNVMGDEGKIAGRDIGEERRYGVAPSIAFGMNSKTRVTLSYFRQAEDNTPDYGIPWLFNAPAPVDRRNYYGYGDSNYLQTTVDAGTAKLEHTVNDSLLLRNQFRYANYHRSVLITEAKTVAGITPSTPPGSIDVTRNQIAALSDETLLLNQFDAVTRFATGSLRHSMVLGAESGRETSDPTRFAYPTNTASNPNTSLLYPHSDKFSAVGSVSSKVKATAVTAAVYAYDTVSIGSKIELSAGIRLDHFDTSYQQFVGAPQNLHRTDDIPNWRAAIIYKPNSDGSVYFTYGTSANPSAEGLSLSAATVDTEPEKNRTFEVGTKWEFKRRLNFRAAVFRTEKTGAREPSTENSAVNVVTGKQRVDGFEVSFSGRITNRWNLLTSYALLDSCLIESRAFPAAVGSRLANVPRNNYALWTTYQFPKHLVAGIGGNFVDSRTASSTAPLDPVTGLVKELPGYWVFNAMASYPITEKLDLQLNVYNLTDRYYYDAPHPGHVVPGPARSARLGLNYRFSVGGTK